MGDVYRKMGKVNNAIVAYTSAATRMEKIKAHYPDIANWLAKKAHILNAQSKLKEGLLMLDTALQVLQFEENNWKRWMW